MKQGIQNGLEKYQGILRGLKKNPDLIAQKDALDKKTREWAAQPGHEKYKAGDRRSSTRSQEEQFRTARVDFDRSDAFGGSRLLATAISLTRWAEERGKKDAGSQARLSGARHGARGRRPEAVREAVRPRRSIARASGSR